MDKVFSDVGWADYVYWQTHDKKLSAGSMRYYRTLNEMAIRE